MRTRHPRGLPAGSGAPLKIAAQPVQLAAHDVLEPPLELETTVRTLDEITRRARGIPARPITTEGNR
ncbi:MAG: hypothetical protein ACRDOH_20240 [Streptosporangiaceae bacterium]